MGIIAKNSSFSLTRIQYYTFMDTHIAMFDITGSLTCKLKRGGLVQFCFLYVLALSLSLYWNGWKTYQVFKYLNSKIKAPHRHRHASKQWSTAWCYAASYLSRTPSCLSRTLCDEASAVSELFGLYANHSGKPGVLSTISSSFCYCWQNTNHGRFVKHRELGNQEYHSWCDDGSQAQAFVRHQHLQLPHARNWFQYLWRTAIASVLCSLRRVAVRKSVGLHQLFADNGYVVIDVVKSAKWCRINWCPFRS